MDEERYRAAEARLWAAVGVTPAERRLRLRRLGVTVRVQEVGEGPPVVFVHGASNSGTSWSTLAARMPGFRCILLDRPGCGLSDRLPRFNDVGSLRAYGDALIVDVLDALGVDIADVAGTSFGGYPVLRGAAAHPDRVRRLVLYGWFTGAPSIMPLFMRASSLRWLARLGTAVLRTSGWSARC